MSSLFEQSLKPPQAKSTFGRTDNDVRVTLDIDGLSFLQQLWAWVASGYVVIPCDVGGTANAIELTPRFRPENGASGYVDGMVFLFTATNDSTDTVTIMVIDDSPLDAIAAYIETTAAGNGDVINGVPYLAIYCDANSGLGLPARMVLK